MLGAFRLAVGALLAGCSVAGLPSRVLAAEPVASPPPRATIETVNGTVQALDLATHALTVLGDGGAFTVSLDRNTLVYLPGGLASVAELRPGARIRLARDGSRAYWVEVREEPGAGTSPPRPSQGTGPGGGGPPAADTTGPSLGAPPPSVGPGPPPSAGAGAGGR